MSSWISLVRSLKQLIRRRRGKAEYYFCRKYFLFFLSFFPFSLFIFFTGNIRQWYKSSQRYFFLWHKMKALKPVSSCNLRLGNPPEFQAPLSLSPLVMSDFSRRLGGSFPVVRKREGRKVNATETSEQAGFTQLIFGDGGEGGGWMMWKLYTARICDRPEKHLMNVHRRSTSRHKPLPFASICYHVPFRHCVLPWKIENCAAVTAEHCSRKCRAAIMSNS